MRLRNYIEQLTPEEVAAARAEGYVVAKDSLPGLPAMVQKKPPETAAAEAVPSRSARVFWEKWSRGR